MDQVTRGEKYSPYRFFSAEDWSEFRADTPLTLTEDELRRLSSLNDPIDLDEVRRIYLALSRLLAAHAESTQALFKQRARFLNVPDAVKTPFIIGIAGSVSVGKSTTARILKELLRRWPSGPKVDLVTTDGFLFPNDVLRERDLMDRKGFPESYDVGGLLRFLSAVKSGLMDVRAPVYSHLTYDVIPDEFIEVDRPDILIFEGINVLQPGELPKDGKIVPFLSDFFDFAIYVDADEDILERWYIARFMRLRETAFRDKESFFHRFSELSEDAARAVAIDIWRNINLKNLRENILPTRPRADLILKKGEDHRIKEVALRKL
ncbi:MAG: type I pantothenate kinase [Proteobacteria bacterium]|nr:type I pantothenate kinase [Pseudomonadota bacterium]